MEDNNLGGGKCDILYTTVVKMLSQAGFSRKKKKTLAEQEEWIISCPQQRQTWFILNNTRTGELEPKQKLSLLNKQRKECELLKNAELVSGIFRKRTSYCLTDMAFLGDVVGKHQSRMLRTAASIICPGQGRTARLSPGFGTLGEGRGLQNRRPVGGRKRS